MPGKKQRRENRRRERDEKKRGAQHDSPVNVVEEVEAVGQPQRGNGQLFKEDSETGNVAFEVAVDQPLTKIPEDITAGVAILGDSGPQCPDHPDATALTLSGMIYCAKCNQFWKLPDS